MKAMIFAAGLGTRLKPLTLSKPKALAEINGITLLEITIKKLINSGFDDIIINIHHFPEQIIKFLEKNKNFEAKITFSDEQDLLLDTGGGLKKAAYFFNDNKPFLVHNVDIVSDINLKELLNIHLKNNCLATLACMKRESSRQFLMNRGNELCGWRNNKTGETIISKGNASELIPISFCGIHIINPEIFSTIIESGVFSIIDVYLRLAKDNKIKINEYSNISWVDIGSPEKLKVAEAVLKTKT